MIKTRITETTEKYDTDRAHECTYELKAKDIIKAMDDHAKRTGRIMFPL